MANLETVNSENFEEVVLKSNIPVSWTTVAVNDVAEVFNGATPSTGNQENYGGDVPC